ncbi:hypothetical protein ACFFRR_003246 [Megaselia abdita]
MGWGAHHSQQLQPPPYSSNDMLCSQNHQSANSAYKLPQPSTQSTDRNTPASTPGYSTPNYSASTMLSPPLTAASQNNAYNFDWFLPTGGSVNSKQPQLQHQSQQHQSDKPHHKSSAALAPCRFNVQTPNNASAAGSADYMSMFPNANFNAEMAGLGRSNNSSNTAAYQQQISSPIVSSSSATTNSFPNTQSQHFSMPSSYHSQQFGHGLPSPTIYPPTPPPSTPSWIHPTWYNGGSGSGESF